MVKEYDGILLSHTNKEMLPFTTACMNLEGVILSEMSQTEKDRNRVMALVRGI